MDKSSPANLRKYKNSGYAGEKPTYSEVGVDISPLHGSSETTAINSTLPFYNSH
jgi:hypothetical protein